MENLLLRVVCMVSSLNECVVCLCAQMFYVIIYFVAFAQLSVGNIRIYLCLITVTFCPLPTYYLDPIFPLSIFLTSSGLCAMRGALSARKPGF